MSDDDVGLRLWGSTSRSRMAFLAKTLLYTDDKIPCILEPELTGKAFRKNWARLIQKIYEVDPLICSRCQGQMRVIAFIHDEDVIRKILKHLGLWDVKRKLPPRAHAPPIIDGFPLYDEPPAPSADEYLTDPDYPVEAYF